MTTYIRSQAFDVYRPESVYSMFAKPGELRHVDTVFIQESPRMTAEDVRRSLVEHDGLPSDIVVTVRR